MDCWSVYHEVPLLELVHLGYSGLRLRLGASVLCVDPPGPTTDPVVVTWSERERTDGARGSSGPLAAEAVLLAWLGRAGATLGPDPTDFAGLRVSALPYAPIPYATPPEALRKTLSALAHPARALGRVTFTLGRPSSPPLALRIEHEGLRVVLLGQALHRFTPDDHVARLAAWAGPVDLTVAGTDYDDERATGALLGRFDARIRVVADLTGDIRRALGLPVRPLAAALAAAPAGTLLLQSGALVRA